jgi:hypothetical protein
VFFSLLARARSSPGAECFLVLASTGVAQIAAVASNAIRVISLEVVFRVFMFQSFIYLFIVGFPIHSSASIE